MKKIPPKFRDFVAQRIGAWPQVGDINVDIGGLGEATADFLDMLAAQVFGEELEPAPHRCDPEGGDHASGCAVHNEPSMPNGQCDCGRAGA